MDVRQLAFLAGQPAAAVKNREHFWGMPKRGLAFLLANVMFWQPMWAQAEGIVVATPGTSLGQAGNGVPIVNIATPNGTGLSHNQFHDYNVGTQGVILNNVAAQTGATQLGGIIVGNPNLTNRIAAQTILNEVVGGSPSQLRGYTEVAGQSARVIVANPYGISCNGCGFINTPRVTLTTGKPVLDNGRLDRFQVDQGSVSIDGSRLNASNVDRFEIITRSAKINAEIQAKNLTIVAGRNDVNAQSLNATARADDGSAKPQLAIDSSALGGMYAGAIKLVGTESGVGVKLDGKLIASGGDIQLDANGHLSLVDTSATNGAVNVKAASLDARGPVYAGTALNVQTQGNLSNQQTLAARDSITLSAGGQLTNNGILEAGVNTDGSRNASGDVSLTAQSLNNTGKSVVASRNLTVNTAQTLSNQGGTLSGQSTNITAGTVDNQNNGRVLSTGALNIAANQVLNAKGVINSTGNLTGAIGQLNNSNGEISSTSITRLNAITLNNRNGQVLGDLGLNIDLSGALDNRDGVLGTGKALDLKAASLDNRDEGVVVSGGSLTARIGGLLDNRNKGEITAKGAIDVRTGSLDNRGGKVTGKDTLTVSSDSADNRGGVTQADKHLKLQIGQLDNRDKGLISGKAGIAYDGTRLDNSGGLLSAVGPVTLKADEVQNTAGRISSQSDLTAIIGLLQQQGGALVAQGNLSLTGATFDNRQDGLVAATKALKIDVQQIDNRAGKLSSTLGLTLNAEHLNNSDGGRLLAGGDLVLKVGHLINQTTGLIQGRSTSRITGTHLDNTDGVIDSRETLNIKLDEALDNTRGLIRSDRSLTLQAGQIDNSAAKLSSADNVSITSKGVLLNQGGTVTSDKALTLATGSLDNSQKGLLSGKAATRVTTTRLDNHQGGRLISGDTLELTATEVRNSDGATISSEGNLTASVTGLSQQGGELFSKAGLRLDLNHGQLNNQGGYVHATGPLVLNNLKDVNNQKGEISSAQAFTLAAQSLDNTGAKLISEQRLSLRVAQLLNDAKGLISASILDSHGERLSNTDGLISSRGALDLNVVNGFDNQRGTVAADGELLLAAGSLDNRAGHITGKLDVRATVNTLDNQNGQMIATGALDLTGSTLDNRQDGLVGATKALTLKIDAIDNRGGELSSQTGTLTVDGSHLNNSDAGLIEASDLRLNVGEVLNTNGGLLNSLSGLALTGQHLDNRNGQLKSQQHLSLDLSGDLRNQQGKINSQRELNLKADAIDNSGGALTSAEALDLSAKGALTNVGGKVVTDAALVLRSASLDNREHGVISAKGVAQVHTGDFDNSQNGSLDSGDTLDLRTAQLTNHQGRIASEKALTASVSGLDQQDGKLFSNQSLSLDLNHGQLNNQGGFIHAPGQLLLTHLDGVDNRNGEISSDEAFHVVANRLNNDGGKLLGNQALTLHIRNTLTSIKGQIAAAALKVSAASLDNTAGNLTSRGDLELAVHGTLVNQNQGLIQAIDGLNIRSADLNNRGGSLLGGTAVTLSAMALDNSAVGLINSKGTLNLNATSLDSSASGEVSANGDMTLNLNALTQVGGRLLGDSALTLNLAGGDLDNRQGRLTAQGPLTINQLRDLKNQNGELSSRQGFALLARNVDNSGGKLLSDARLGLTVAQLINQNGLISGLQGLGVEATSLDNRNHGTLSSKYGDLNVDLKGTALNSNAGALVSNGTLKLTAASLDNSNGGVVSSLGSQQLNIAGDLNNADGGQIDSDGTLNVHAANLNNHAGKISALQDLDITAGSLDNSAGTLSGKGAINLDLLGNLSNVQGVLNSNGALLLKHAAQIDNRGGKLMSQRLLTLTADSLDNRDHGTVAANEQTTLTLAGAARNSNGGLIYSRDAGLSLKAASLDNAKGAIQSQKALNLEILGDVDNQSGKIIVQDEDLMLSATNLDNRGGALSSIKGALEAKVSGVLRNGYDLNNNRQGGMIEAQRLTLRALAGLDNNGGRIAARTADASVHTADLNNRNGALLSGGQIRINANGLDNTAGQIGGQLIDLSLNAALNNQQGIIESDSNLAVRASSLDNRNGQVRATGGAGKTAFQIGGLFDNRNGRLEVVNTDLSLAVGGFQNVGGSVLHSGTGEFDMTTANILGAGGTLVTRGGMTLNADSWSNSSVIQAGRLKVNVNNFYQSASGQLLTSERLEGSGGNWTNDGLIASDGSLNLQLTGVYGGNGRLSSQGDLTLGAAQLNLPSAASLAGGGDTRINVGGQLNNFGRLSSRGALMIDAGSISNRGTLASGQGMTLTTGDLLNAGISATEHSLISSGGDMQLLANTFNNRYAEVYSMGRLLIAANAGQAQSSLLENRSGSIESVGDLTIRAMTVKNVRDILTVSGHEKYFAEIHEIPCAPFGKCHVKSSGGRRNAVWQVTERDRLIVSESSDASSIMSGGRLNIGAQQLSNQSSSIAASGDLAINAASIENLGVESKDLETISIKYNHVYEFKGAKKAVAKFNANNKGKVSATFEADMAAFNKLMTGGTISVKSHDLPGSGLTYDAIIQSGAAVQLTASQNINNSVVRGYYAYVGGGKKTGDTSVGSQYSTPIYINSQLPPDLAQQQVNPLTLPGFNLPAGQNGMFRLSGQGASATAPTQANVAPQSWTMGSASLSLAQHTQQLPVSQGRVIQVGDVAAVAASERQLDAIARQSVGVDVSLPSFVTTIPADGASANLPLANRTSLGSQNQTIARVQGLPSAIPPSNPHKYLIETNPVLTDLKQFMSSDYLLSNLGYDLDKSAKRLGDGLYEQRLVQQAVVARTGQRFINGQTSDEGLFKYLMNNAIVSKQQLDLAVGVTLTSQQVAALTHDIVWLEEHEVNGEKVLVPVLYLANANQRLASNGALIAGKDVSLIAGKDLINAGTLRASNNLSASAGNDLVNSGLIEAGNRLDLLAGNNLVNKTGGIIAGRDVSLTTLRGDLINERTVTSHQSASGDLKDRHDFLDSAARIEAANDLTLNAGRDLNNTGGVLQAKRDTTINAGRDANLVAVEEQNSETRSRFLRETITQHGSEITTGQDLSVRAGRDLTAIASQIEAKRNLSMDAGQNLTLASAADESHSFSKSKKVTSQRDHVSQVSTNVTAGGNVALSAGKDLDLIASRVSAGDEAYLFAANNLTLQSAEDSDYSFYSKTKKSSSGKKSRLDEVASTTNIASAVTSGGNSTLLAGKDMLIKGSEIAADKGGVQLVAGNDMQVVAVTDSNSARHESSSSKSSWGGLKSSKVKDQLSETQTTAVGSVISGNTVDVAARRDVTVTGSSLVSTQDLKVAAGRDLTINAAENTFTRNELHKEKNRDLTGVLTANNLGVDDITGNQHLSVSSQNHTGKSSQTTLTGSTIGSSAGNVSLSAGRNLGVIASDLVSTQNMTLNGSNVTIAAGMESASQSSTDKSSSLAVGRVIGGAVVDTANSIRAAVKAANDADDPRLKAVKLAQAALAAYNLNGMASQTAGESSGFKDKQGGTASNGSLIKIGTELANTHSKSTSEYTSQTAKQSTLNAGKDLTITSAGNAAGTLGDIHVVGSSLKAANTLLLAKNDITLESARNTADWTNNNTNNKTSIGASFNIGQQNGFTLDLGAQIAKSMGTGSSVTQVNSTLDTGSLLLRSGNDTTLAGAQVRADSIQALIDGNLNIISRQDSETQKNKQGSGGFGASICIPPFCYGSTATASASLAAGNMSSEYKQVTDQSGLFAGTGGYSLDVGKNTTLQGAVIASQASADKNLLITDRLIVSDIKNVSEINSQSAGVSVSGSYGGGAASASVGGLSGIALEESDHSKTRSAVSEGTIIVRNTEGANDLVGLNRDTANANDTLDKPDQKAMEERMELVRSSMELVKGVGDAITAAKIKEANDPDSETSKAARQKLLDNGVVDPSNEQVAKQVQNDYGVGSSFQKANQAVTAIVQGLIGGNIGGALAGAAAPYLAQTVKDMTDGDGTANLMAHAVLGAVIARAGGNSALAGAAGAVVAEGTARLIREELYGGLSNEELTQEQKQTISALATLAAGIAGSVTGKDALSAVASAQVGRNAVENNFLSPADQTLLDQLRQQRLGRDTRVSVAQKLVALDKLDQISNALMERYRRHPETMSDADKVQLNNYLQEYTYALINAYGPEVAQAKIDSLTRSGPLKQSDTVAYASYSAEKQASLDRLYPGGLVEQMSRPLSQNEQLYLDSLGTLRINQNYQALADVGTPALYVMSGSLGLGIRLVAAESGALQIVYGGVQAYNGDTWAAAGNIVMGALNIAGSGVNGVLKGGGGSGAKGTVSKNPNATSALTDSEAGTLVERNVLEASPKVINQAEPEVLAKVNNGRSPYSELNGAIGEARGWSQAIESGQTPISGPGKASLPGADYITYDPSSRSVIVWDAKYRAPGGSYPTSLSDSKLQAWQSEIINSVKNMPEGQAKIAAENALKAGRVEGRIFKWPQ
ncbi:hemagglutinin repeat-containing protein [Pseudomonas sp. NPDC098740]|uniref:two-partner secretion domain-containing protein n=1 Tax=Pseudomonas sp. NPDC098740 TaxID=3364486 RepID=UPI00383BADB4